MEYRYAVPLHETKEDKKDAKQHRLLLEVSYGWVHGGWGECNVHCGGGKQQQTERVEFTPFKKENLVGMLT